MPLTPDVSAYEPLLNGSYVEPRACTGRGILSSANCGVQKFEANLRYNASGVPGTDGTDGPAGGYPAGKGQDGTAGSRGGPAGAAALVLRGDGEGFLANGTRYMYSEVVNIQVAAAGGPGGHGGNGGAGGDGQPGSRGSDATQWSAATDGGPGGPGGDGGHGGDGGAGGAGGKITIATSEEGAYLLMMCTGLEEEPAKLARWVAGGEGGRGGAGGRGGNGGPGGPGGSPCTWTETKTDRDGHSVSQTHSKPGGRDGPHGPDGSSGARGQDGLAGADGKYSIQVGGIEYVRRYHMHCVNFKLSEHPAYPDEHDGIFEFGEVMACNNFVVENPMHGSMSTPTIHQRAEINLRPNATWTSEVPDSNRLPVFVGPGVKMPGSTQHTLPTEMLLECFIRYPDLYSYGEDFGPVSADDQVFVKGTQLGHQDNEMSFCRQYHSFGDSSAQPFTAHFPVVNIHGIDCLPAVAQGERCIVRFHVKNNSRLALGSEESRQRKVTVRWDAKHSAQSGEEESAYQFVDIRDEFSEKRELPLTGNLPSLPAIGSDYVQIQVGWREDTPDFAEVSLHASLSLQAPSAMAWSQAPESMRQDENMVDCQRRKHVLRCVPTFHVPADVAEAPVSAIVIYSPGARSDVCKLWVTMLREYYSMPTAVWDISRYGHFQPAKNELLKEMVTSAKNLLVVVFDYEFKVQAATARAEVERVLPSAMLDQSILRRELPTSNLRMLLISETEASKHQTLQRLNAVVDVAAFSVEEDGAEALDKGKVEVPPEGVHYTIPCIEHSMCRCGLPDSYNKNAVTKLARGLCHELVEVSAERRGVAVHKQMVPEEVNSAPSKCCGCRRAYQVGRVDVMLERQHGPGSASDGAAHPWDHPLEVFATCGPHDIETCKLRLRSLRWIVAVALPREAKVELLVSALRRAREAVAAEAEIEDENLQGMLMTYVTAMAHEVKRDIEVASPDISRPVQESAPSLSLLNRYLAAASLPALPLWQQCHEECAVPRHCYTQDDFTMWTPVLPAAGSKPKAEAPAEASLEAGLARAVVAVDTSAGILIATDGPDGTPAKDGSSKAKARWHFKLGLTQQMCFMWWEWWQFVLFSLAAFFSFGLFLVYLCTRSHHDSFKRLWVVALPTGSGMTSRAHALTLNATRELLCRLRMLLELARAAKSPPGGQKARRRLTEHVAGLIAQSQALLLPEGSWVPCVTKKGAKANQRVESFLQLRSQGLQTQRVHLAGRDMHRVLGLEGWAKWTDPEGEEVDKAKAAYLTAFELDVPHTKRGDVLSALEWSALHDHHTNVHKLRQARSLNILDKHTDMVVTDDTAFTTCNQCGRRIPVKHQIRHETTECAKREQGIDYIKRMLSTPADRKHLSDQHISALRVAAHEGHAALSDKERADIEGMLEYVFLEKRLEAVLSESAMNIEPFELEDLVDTARTAAASRALGDTGEAQGIHVAEGFELLNDVVQYHAVMEFDKINENGIIASAAVVLQEPDPPLQRRRQQVLLQAFGDRPWAVVGGQRAIQAQANSSSKNLEIDDDAFVNYGQRLFALFDLASKYSVELPDNILENCAKVALAHMWLGHHNEEDLSMRLQFCRKFNLQTNDKYIRRAVEVKELKKVPQDWNLDAMLDEGTGDLAREDISQEAVIAAFQELFDLTFQAKYTRDRLGGKLPTKMEVLSVKKVMNRAIWESYVVFREKVRRSWGTKLNGWPRNVTKPITQAWLQSEQVKALPNLISPLLSEVNETLLFHGTSPAGAENITKDDFRIDLAGTGAGTLYGHGVYLAECCTKSDEYTKPHLHPEGLRIMLVCRATLGSIYYTDEATPDVQKLEKKCGFMSQKAGWYHSVLGDREKCKQTFREFVVFNSDLVYPAFIVFYKHVE